MTGRGGNDRRPPADMTGHNHSGLRRRTAREGRRFAGRLALASLLSELTPDNQMGHQTVAGRQRCHAGKPAGNAEGMASCPGQRSGRGYLYAADLS